MTDESKITNSFVSIIDRPQYILKAFSMDTKLKQRKAMYKNTVPSWKDTYRKRCQERLKSSRDQFLGRFRCGLVMPEAGQTDNDSVVENLMLEEWKILRCEQQGLPALEDSKNETNGAEPYDEYLSIFEEIRAELLREEQQILAEYEAGLCHEEASMYSTVQGLSQDSVLCPVCQKNYLLLNKGVLFCNCGIRIETEQDCITLENVRQNLDDGLGLHSPECSGQPRFGVVNQLSIQNMLMTCSECDFMHIIV